MKITPDHWLDEARRAVIPGGNPMPVRRALAVHFTSGATARSSIEFWLSPAAKGASAHAIIDRDGTVFQCRPFDRTCGHAGVSRWRDPHTGTLYTGLNSCSIGLELANAGDDATLARRFSALPLLQARHRNGGPLSQWERYPEPQLASARVVARALVERYHLDDITGHDCIAPERKNDPGPAFPMQAFRETLGFTTLPKVFQP